MEVVREALVAFLASVGLTALLWLSMTALLRRRERLPTAVVLLPLYGAAEDLETSVRTLRWLGDPTIWLVNCGLNEEGTHRAQLLVQDREDLRFLTPEELPEYMKKR